jgi:RNA polymerase sigma-70 factor (ECF subfamily)
MGEDLLYIEEAKGGDKNAFSFLIDKYQKQIFHFIYQFFRDYQLSLEITQETFLRAFKFLHTYDSDKKFSTWLYSIAKNLCIDEMKRHSRAVTIPIAEVKNKEGVTEGNPLYFQKDPDSAMIRHQEGDALLEAVNKLPEKYRMVITLCYFEEMTYEEIADVVDIPISTVKVRIFRAKKKLLKLLEDKV